MHEAGLAEALAATIRAEGLLGGPVRVHVTGGHDEPTAFDAALRFHLGAILPELDEAALEIVHEASEHWCADCGSTFSAVWDEPCPECGGSGLALRMEESIEVEGAGPPGPSDPRIDDRRPSAAGPAAGHAGSMEGHDPGRTVGLRTQRPDDQVT